MRDLLLNIWGKLKAIGLQLLIILFYILLNYELQIIFQVDLKSTNPIVLNLVYITMELLLLTCFIILFRKQLIPDFYDFKNNTKMYIKKYYKYWLIGLGVMIVSNAVIVNVIGLGTNETLVRNYLGILPVYMIFSAVLCAPVIEECMTRVLLKNNFSPIIYYTLSGLIFGLLHVMNTNNPLELLYVISYGALGFTFAYIYNKSNNIWTNIFFHMLHNAIAIALIL